MTGIGYIRERCGAVDERLGFDSRGYRRGLNAPIDEEENDMADHPTDASRQNAGRFADVAAIRIKQANLERRDYFANQAMSGLIASMPGHELKEVARLSYMMADEMEKARVEFLDQHPSD